MNCIKTTGASRARFVSRSTQVRVARYRRIVCFYTKAQQQPTCPTDHILPLRFNNSTDHRALPLSPTYDIYTYSDRAWKDLPEYVIMVDKHLFGKNHEKIQICQ